MAQLVGVRIVNAKSAPIHQLTRPPIHPSTHPPSHPRAHPLVHPHATCNIIAKYAMTNEKNMMIYTHRSCNYNTQMTKIVPINAKHTKNPNIQILYFCVATSAHKSTESVCLGFCCVVHWSVLFFVICVRPSITINKLCGWMLIFIL